MTKKILRLLALMLLVTTLSGCGVVHGLISLVAPDVTEATDLPHLLVRQIDVCMYPNDGEFTRHYESQQNLTAILQALRGMVTTKAPEEAPSLTDGQAYYAVTATYACGDQQVYYLLGYQYMKVGEEDWCTIEFDRAMDFVQYLKQHPSDNGTYIPPATLPTPATEAPETEAPPTEA